jgi:hypothetical protein
MSHCASESHLFRPREVQAPIYGVGSEQEQGPIAAAKTTSARMSTLPVEAVGADIAYSGGRGESGCLHVRSHNHNRILSAHSRHIRVLAVQLAAKVEEVGYSGPAYSHSRNHSHSHSRAHSQYHDMSDYMLPLLLGSRKWEDARARAPCAVLAAARSTDPMHIGPDHRTASHRARTLGAHARECHKDNIHALAC